MTRLDSKTVATVPQDTAYADIVEADSTVKQVSSAPIFLTSAPEGLVTMRVYRKKSTFKGAPADAVWYSATRSDGNSVICKFKCPVPDAPAFEIGNVMGSLKKSEVIVNGASYTNFTYYINSCDFFEIAGEELPL